jgi:hypothetical protein
VSAPPSPARRRLDEIEEAFQKLQPGRVPLTEAERDHIARTVESWPPMTDTQCMRVGRLLRDAWQTD